MGYGNSRRFRKFYWEQVELVRVRLEKFVNSNSNIDVDKYLAICEQLGHEPDPARMPLELSDFPDEVQVAFFVFSLLPDRWEGMSGTYMGKDYANLQYIFDLYEIDDPKVIFEILKLYESIVVEKAAKDQKVENKRAEQKAKAGGKNYVHNVRG